jgi:hypothetical protein
MESPPVSLFLRSEKNGIQNFSSGTLHPLTSFFYLAQTVAFDFYSADLFQIPKMPFKKAIIQLAQPTPGVKSEG